MDRAELKETIREVLAEDGTIGTAKIGSRWIGGEMILQPADMAQQAKVIPVEAFFHKIVMVRDRLRVLEQHINSSKKLDDADKVDLQQYITRIYGSLTTFNVLFAEPDDCFRGEKTR